jgi:hypothetical protein
MKKLTQQDGTTLLVSDEQLQEIINSQPKKIESSIGWKPIVDERYFYFNNIDVSSAINELDNIDYENFKRGNCYKTREEAESMINKQKAIRRIHVYMRENGLIFDDVNWDNFKITKYQIVGWDYFKMKPEENQLFYSNESKGELFFRLEEDRQKVLDNYKEDLEIFLK